MSTQQNSSEQAQPTFAIQTLYIKDISFESPNAPEIFRENWQPNVTLDLNINSRKLENTVYEVVLELTVTAKAQEKVAFIAEVKQAGIFTLEHFNEQQIHHLLGSYCPNTLFPYARERISDLVNSGGFPRLFLAPVNFDALYEQRFNQSAQQQSQATQPAEPEVSS